MTEIRRPRRGEEIELTIDELDARGHGLGLHGEHPVRVAAAVPGDRWRVGIRGRRKGITAGHGLELVAPSPDRVEPRCPHERSCGGCAFQTFDVEAQHREAHRLLHGWLQGAGVEVALDAVLPGSEPWHYRNKMEFSFGSRRYVEDHEPEGAERSFALGLHAPGRFDKILDLSSCSIAFLEATPIMSTVRRLARERGLEPWDVRAHTGLLRHLVMRKGFGTGEIMVHLLTSTDDDSRLAPFFADLLAAHPEITTLVHGINGKPADTAIAERSHLIHGSGFIFETLAGLRFRISPASFFQTNTVAAEKLFAIIRELAAPRGNEVVHDLYCGAGTIGLGLAEAVGEVHGFELVEPAVVDARNNAADNGITNATFTAGDVLETWARARGEKAPDLLILDPPRVGLHKDVLAAVVEARVPRVLFVSCNVKTTAPQLAALCDDAGYRVTAARPVDLFPHTPHVECVFLLELAPGT